MVAVTRGTRVECPFCSGTHAVENPEEDTCWRCDRTIIIDSQLIDEEDVIGRPEENL